MNNANTQHDCGHDASLLPLIRTLKPSESPDFLLVACCILPLQRNARMDEGSRTYEPSDTEYADVLDVLCQVEQGTVDELGLLELSDGEECLHAIQCSISKPKSKDSEDGELGQILVGTKHIYVRVVTGLESKVQYRVPYQQVTRWDVRCVVFY